MDRGHMIDRGEIPDEPIVIDIYPRHLVALGLAVWLWRRFRSARARTN